MPNTYFYYFVFFRIRKEFLGRKSLADKGYSQIRSKILRKENKPQERIHRKKNLADKGHSQIRSKSLGRKINLRKEFIGRKTLLIKVIHKSGVNP